ncbi:MAG: DUF3820 family protein [Bdellovibrionota bacterium]|nr:DUF3820 family protein [Bdellovibrionota bacterium]
MQPNIDILFKLARTQMPYGKYKGRILVDLPEPYIVWYKNKGFPSGEIGSLLAELFEIKRNGLESLLEPFKEKKVK